jgi:hypothetical protein
MRKKKKYSPPMISLVLGSLRPINTIQRMRMGVKITMEAQTIVMMAKVRMMTEMADQRIEQNTSIVMEKASI